MAFFFQAEDGIRDKLVTGVQTCALPILRLAIANRGERKLLCRTVLARDRRRTGERLDCAVILACDTANSAEIEEHGKQDSRIGSAERQNRGRPVIVSRSGLVRETPSCVTSGA